MYTFLTFLICLSISLNNTITYVNWLEIVVPGTRLLLRLADFGWHFPGQCVAPLQAVEYVPAHCSISKIDSCSVFWKSEPTEIFSFFVTQLWLLLRESWKGTAQEWQGKMHANVSRARKPVELFYGPWRGIENFSDFFPSVLSLLFNFAGLINGFTCYRGRLFKK